MIMFSRTISAVCYIYSFSLPLLPSLKCIELLFYVCELISHVRPELLPLSRGACFCSKQLRRKLRLRYSRRALVCIELCTVLRWLAEDEENRQMVTSSDEVN